MCHSENRHGNKQNKNRWGLQTVDTRKTDAAINRIKTSGDLKSAYSYGRKQNKNRWDSQSAHRDNLKTLNIELKLGRDKAHEIDLMRR